MTLVIPNKGESFAHIAGRRYTAFCEAKGKKHAQAQYYLSLNPHIKDTEDFKKFEKDFDKGREEEKQKYLEEPKE